MALSNICLTCGMPNGYESEILRKIKQIRLEAEIKRTNTLPQNAIIDPEIDIRLGDVLNALRRDSICCRRIITISDNRDFIY